MTATATAATAGSASAGSAIGHAARDLDVRDMWTVTKFMGTLVVAGVVFLFIYDLSAGPAWNAAPLFWSVALLAGAMAVGFLFGIPRVLQGKPAAGAATANGKRDAAPAAAGDRTYDLRVNTNLEEISDWLTKIIVGLGLVQLKELPAKVSLLATRIAQGFGADDASRSVALGMILFFCSVGFLYGYLMTRLYLQGALARAERGIIVRELQDVREIASAALSASVNAGSRRPGSRRAPDSEPKTEDEKSAATALQDLWFTDPHEKFADGLSEANGRRVTARIVPIASNNAACRVHLEVVPTDPRRPVTTPTKILLHPTFAMPTVVREPDPDGVVRYDFVSAGVFTVGVETDHGATKLQLDLARVPGGTKEFYEN